MLAQNVLQMEQDNARLREENAALRRMLGTEPPKPMNCEACRFFIQHYMRSGTQYARTNAGHCVHGRIRNRKPEDKNCGYFEAGRHDRW
ncbi:MAG: hypothetical protein K2N94_07465 [Lachnospiraceae bacterium]|nr:hypothetical protein [Lachnospiraceae bacterium]